MNQLLTNKHGVTIGEFLQSGLSEGLCDFLTMPPKSEEMGDLSSTDARTIILRSKTFLHAIVVKTNDKSPYQTLISLNHDALS